MIQRTRSGSRYSSSAKSVSERGTRSRRSRKWAACGTSGVYCAASSAGAGCCGKTVVERCSDAGGRPMSTKVDAFLKRQDKWGPEFEKLREILLDTGLTEDLKWGQPCYALDGKNVALIHGFKEYCAILFPKGALLQDPKGVLIQQTKNVQAARQIRFTSVQEVTKLAKTVKAYVREAIE